MNTECRHKQVGQWIARGVEAQRSGHEAIPGMNGHRVQSGVNGRSVSLHGPGFGRDDLYGAYCKPKVSDMLEALGLNVEFEEALGVHVYTSSRVESSDRRRTILDLVGGFGACLFGHNNPELKAHLIGELDRNCPTFVQATTRPEAGGLARRLNALIPAKGKYFCNFANSGTEAVEAALKHAYKVRFDAIREVYEEITRTLNDFFQTHDAAGDALELPGDFSDLSKFRDSIDEHNLAQFEDFQHNPVVCAFKGAFHGKTTTALKLTFNKSYRESFEGLSALKSVFFEMGRPERVKEIVRQNQLTFLIPETIDGRVEVKIQQATKVIGLIVEIILGEGGVKPVPDSTLEYLASEHDEIGIPYIIDEVQTGCGRTGAFAAYTRTPLARIEPEYILFGKALGGGLVKISATLIHERVYDPDFGLLHTSTFGEDELSCSVAGKAIEMLSRNDGSLLREISEKGAYFKEKLEALRAEHPSVIQDVRGRGLMLGLQFTTLEQYGNFFRYAGQKGFVSLLIASYLLHHHDIRVLAPLTTLYKGNPGKTRESIIRIQPPAQISTAQIDAFVEALEECIHVILRRDEFSMVAHLIGAAPEAIHTDARPVARKADERRRTNFDARVGFIVNLTTLSDLYGYYLPSFRNRNLDERSVIAWWNRLCRFLEPEVVHTTYVESEGFVVEANIVGVPYFADRMIRLFGRGRNGSGNRHAKLELKELRDKIKDASIVARDLGDERIPTSIVGLGSFTSIVMENGLLMNDYEIPITTGNTYTTGLMLQGIEEAAERRGLDLSRASVAVVGAAGNIGRTLACLFSRNAGTVYLVGRGGSESDERLDRVRRECQAWAAARAADASGNGRVPRIEIAGHEALRACEVVAVATNSTKRDLLGPETVMPGAIVSCASVPSNLSSLFDSDEGERFVFDGGFARLPEGAVIDCVGMPKDGLAFGCLSETLLLGFEGRNRSFARGDLDPDQVLDTLRMAEDYGFSLGDFQLNGRPLNADASMIGG